MTITQEDMDALSRKLFHPIMLALDAWMFQYLVLTYYTRRVELRVCLLLAASFLSFASHVYFHDDHRTMVVLNSISETSLQLTFLTQITIIGRDVLVKVKLRTIAGLTYAAEVLVLLGWLHVCTSFIEAAGVNCGKIVHVLGNVLESISLIFVVIFRIFYLSLSGGFRLTLAQRKMEFLIYSVFAIHEVPFAILEHHTGVVWEFAQGTCNRLTILACVLLNVHHKARPIPHVLYSGKKNSATVVAPRGSVASSRGSFLKSGAIANNNPLHSMASSRGAVLKNPSTMHSVAQEAAEFPYIAKIAVTSN